MATPLDSDAAINQRIFDTSLDLILVVDRQGNFIRVSPSVREILGYAPEELAGRNAGGYVYPDDLDPVRAEMRIARHDRVTRNFECRYVHKSGRVVVMWWTGVWSVAEEQFFFIGRDVTERREAQRREREDAARIALAVEISEMGLVSADSPSEPARTDAQFNRIYGLAPGTTEIGASDFLRLIHAEDRDAVAAGLLEVIRGGGLYRGEFRIRRADTGEDRWVRAATRTVRNADGQPGRFVGAHLDITDLRSTQLQLQQAQKMEALGQLTGGMAHDFNNLLGVVIGNLDLLRDSAPLAVDDKELLSEAIDAATRGADLIRRLLAFSRRQPLQPLRLEVNGLVSGIVGLLGRTLGEHIPISLTLGDGIWPVRVDPAQLEASLINLATNARDAMPGGGRLIVTTGNRYLDADYAASHAEVTAGDYAMIEVSDTGGGIPPEIVTRIFEPFFTTKEVGKGNGLGLSMVFGFVKQSGGHVNVYSEPGAGTTFRLYLPRDRQGTERAAETAGAPEATQTAGGGQTVLIVEDNPGMRRIVRRQLAELGYRVVEAEGAAAALDILAREPVALLFSDIVMPGTMNGIVLAQRAIEGWPGIRVILTSGFPDARLGDEVAGIRLLSKPYRRADLADAVRVALEAS
ncbi:MAG TPA: PAS domain S-box protein [Stellaceae bacterium]|nr:PAS domain S-box protein [Stellaceae bacterium]